MIAMNHSRRAAGFAALAAAVLIVGGCAAPESAETDGKVDYTKMSAEELGEYLVMQSGSWDLKQEVQEGGTARERMTQDELQKVCSEARNQPSPEQAGQIIADARASITYPEGGIQLGDWRRGQDLSWGGFGFRIAHNPDDHSRRDPSGNCYNCHAMSPDRVGGTLGPSLTAYGKQRGNNEATRRFVWEMMYNPHAYFPCSNMPRMGAKGLLSHEAMMDIMAYVLHPDSPVNQ
ncbi:sulfur oxidation c-type cytochrome SoxX [Thioalkalivibrio denitrificans]|uniref:Sulfur oxidation c-type cytochrome SoxX n=1 Tax=Thioalkalivibrio denitrificans TaxID=108003 RepID=A0A1V3N8U6_9GAMM|nr:sulfur oxidation c-type cytochrome SoxX [Thioalkalivibrio denitrificans]OOG21226.1 sulfur oxidation c-type cytochrome SoxX [Thioalkalivibrio denitrificans]